MTKNLEKIPSQNRVSVREKKSAQETATITSRVSELLLRASSASTSGALQLLETTGEGLSEQEAANRLAKFGKNEVAHERAPHWILQLWRAFANPFIAVLVTLMLVSLITDVLMAAPADKDWKTIIVLSVMISVSTLLRFVTEFKSTRAAEALKALVSTTATVLRRSSNSAHPSKSEVPISLVVPGDIVMLGAGDMVPADIRLLSSKDLFVSQSALTGESLPVEKFDALGAVQEKIAHGTGVANGSGLEAQNLCFMGTNVISGTSIGLVIASGRNTYFGSMSKSILGYRSETSFDKGVKNVSYLLIKFMLVMVPVIFVINGFSKHDWKEAFLFGIAVAVGLTPEMLPMIVSANLAKGALLLAKKKCVVKRINSIQNLGAMDVLCTDKTGTLTRDKIVLERYLDIHGQRNQDVLDFAYLNSYHQTGLKNLLDKAVLHHVDTNGEVERGKSWEKIDEIPFDFSRRRMSVVLRRDDNSHVLICKGAVEEVIPLCNSFEEDGNIDLGGTAPFLVHNKQEALTLSRELNEDGLRVVAVAYREFYDKTTEYAVADESRMVLVGFVGFLDPPKESAEMAIRALNEHGIAIKVLTGDNDLIARNVCRQVGIESQRIVLGTEVEAMSDAELARVVEENSIFAKLTPLQKARIVRILKANGHTVGYLGDGINDAASLRDADVGISVDSAADIAKESSDIIMLEKDLMVLAEGVLEGRNTFGNIIKYIKMTASSNFGNVFSVLVASAFIPFLPMLAIQLLIQNTLYDLSQTTIPFDRVDPEYLTHPRKWRSDDIARFMVCIGPISSIFDITTFTLMWFLFKANSPAHAALFQSGWFIEGLLSQTLVVHMIRTEKVPFLQSRAAWPVMLTTVVIMGFGILIPFTRFGASVGLVPLPLVYFPWLVITLFLYCSLTQFVKNWYIRRFAVWL